MKAFVLATSEGLLLFTAKEFPNLPDSKRTIGAYVPGQDGNYYGELLIGFRESDDGYSLGFSSWWEWTKASIAKGETLIDEDYGFDPDDIRVVPFEIPLEFQNYQN